MGLSCAGREVSGSSICNVNLHKVAVFAVVFGDKEPVAVGVKSDMGCVVELGGVDG